MSVKTTEVTTGNGSSRVLRCWWSEDRRWFCMYVSDGVGGIVTLSLSPDEAGALSGAINDKVEIDCE